jgi:putative DNA primase/helicase
MKDDPREFVPLDDPRHRKPSADEDAPEFSDDALALAFTTEHGDDLRYVAAWNRWLKWDGTRWAHENTLLAFNHARAICREAAAAATKETVAKAITSAKTVAGVVALARVDRQHAATTDQWDDDPWLLNTPGGMVDLVTGRMREHRREAYCTKITAAAPGAGCPLWLKFLDRIFDKDAELIAFVQRVAGYALTGITREHALFFGFGTGANGKSVFGGNRDVRIVARRTTSDGSGKLERRPPGDGDRDGGGATLG